LRIPHAVKPVGFHAFRRFRFNVAQKKWRPEGFGTLLDEARARKGRALYSKLKDDVTSAKSGQNAPDLALSWYTLVYKTGAKVKAQKLRNAP
jgi:hypothetical protein